MLTDKYHIYRHFQTFPVGDQLGAFLGRGRLADLRIPGMLFEFVLFSKLGLTGFDKVFLWVLQVFNMFDWVELGFYWVGLG